MSPYIHQRSDWPTFRWDQDALVALLAAIRHRQGRLLGRMEGLGFALQKEAQLETLTLDVVKSSEIEGETLNPEQVRSSIARRLGLDAGGTEPADRDVEGVVEMMLDATQNFQAPLTDERLFGWHAALFPTGRSGMRKIIVGAWRDDHGGPMQVSGPVGKEEVHYEAPAAALLPEEMARFLAWANDTDRTDAVLRAGLAHLWLVTIHPFDDGNGRIARAIADWQLARSENSAQRFYSMSAQVRHERNDYYVMLEHTQKGTLDVTSWLEWFLGCLGRAFDGTETTLAGVLRKARFWERTAPLAINGRQRLVLNRLLDGFTGKLTTKKWAVLAKCSHDTALRDIQSLIDQGLLKRDEGGGRSTSYSLAGQQQPDPFATGGRNGGTRSGTGEKS
jgi:Fic family protein